MYCRLVTKRLPRLKYLDTLPVGGNAPRMSQEARHVDARFALIRSASQLLRGGGASPRRVSLGAQVIRKRMASVCLLDSLDESRASSTSRGASVDKENEDANRNLHHCVSPSVGAASAIAVAAEKLEQAKITREEYDHIVRMVSQIKVAEAKTRLSSATRAQSRLQLSTSSTRHSAIMSSKRATQRLLTIVITIFSTQVTAHSTPLWVL